MEIVPGQIMSEESKIFSRAPLGLARSPQPIEDDNNSVGYGDTHRITPIVQEFGRGLEDLSAGRQAASTKYCMLRMCALIKDGIHPVGWAASKHRSI